MAFPLSIIAYIDLLCYYTSYKHTYEIIFIFIDVSKQKGLKCPVTFFLQNFTSKVLYPTDQKELQSTNCGLPGTEVSTPIFIPWDKYKLYCRLSICYSQDSSSCIFNRKRSNTLLEMTGKQHKYGSLLCESLFVYQNL